MPPLLEHREKDVALVERRGDRSAAMSRADPALSKKSCMHYRKAKRDARPRFFSKAG